MTQWTRKRVRPLGSFIKDSPRELLKEKSAFKNDLCLLSDIVNNSQGQKDQPVFHGILTNGFYSRNNTYKRTRSRLVVNDARKAALHSKIRDRVQSANNDTAERLRFQNSICERTHCLENQKLVKGYQCEVLGTSYCTDCIQRKRRIRSAETQRCDFPYVDTTPKFLIAPSRIKRLENEMCQTSAVTQPKHIQTNGNKHVPSYVFYDRKSSCVYTPSEIYNRVRELHRLEGHNPFGKDRRPIPNKAGLLPVDVFEQRSNRSKFL